MLSIRVVMGPIRQLTWYSHSAIITCRKAWKWRKLISDSNHVRLWDGGRLFECGAIEKMTGKKCSVKPKKRVFSNIADNNYDWGKGIKLNSNDDSDNWVSKILERKNVINEQGRGSRKGQWLGSQLELPQNAHTDGQFSNMHVRPR